MREIVSVVGESFRNDDGSSRQDEIARCSAGEEVELVRDPSNRFDAKCVKVMSARGVQIGNIGRGDGWIADAIDQRKTLSAEIDYIGLVERDSLLGVRLAVNRVPTTVANAAGQVRIEQAAGPSKVRVDSFATRGKTPQQQPARKGCIVALLAVFGLFVLGQTFAANSPEYQKEQAAKAREKAFVKAEEEKVAAEKVAEDRRKGFHCLSKWDGSMLALKEAVKDRLREPDSFEHVETRITPEKNGKHAVMMTYRARNGFGGMNVESALGTVDHATCHLTLISMG